MRKRLAALAACAAAATVAVAGPAVASQVTATDLVSAATETESSQQSNTGEQSEYFV
jgi:nitrous oxide reductase